MRIEVMSVLCMFGLVAFGTEYFADAVNGNDAWDGTVAVHEEGTSHGPKLSVQAAVDLAQVGSTTASRNIVTLLPGDYTNGVTGVTDGSYVTSNRVYITKPILLRSKNGRASRDVTRIVGYRDNVAAKMNLGPASIRCVYVAKSGVGTRLEGAYLCGWRGLLLFGGGIRSERRWRRLVRED